MWKTNNSITGVTRGLNFSSAVSHSDTDTATYVNVVNIDLSNKNWIYIKRFTSKLIELYDGWVIFFGSTILS